MTTSRLQTWIDDRADAMADLLVRLVAVDSENPPGRGLGRCARLLGDAMDDLGLAPQIVPVDAGASGLDEPCLVRGGVGTGDRVVYFHGHFDVVPAQRRDQFAAVRRDGRVVGRGTADMKGGLVSMLYGAAAANALGLLRDGRVVLHLVCDEETGSVVGAGHLRDAGMIDPGALAMVTAEPSSGAVWHAARGAVSVRVDVRGVEAHVGHADRGVNAFLHMLHVARPVERYAAELAERGSMVVVGGEAGGGTNFNVVPGAAYFTVDGRYAPDADLDAEVARLTTLVDDAAREVGADVTVSVTQRQPPAHTDPDHPAATALAGVVAEVTGEPARFALCEGILETRWYAERGVPAFGYGAGRLDVSHGPEEYVDEAAMRRCAAVYAGYAAALLS